MTQRCAIYIRVSSEEQTHGHSLEAQKDLCVQYAKSRGWEVVAIFEGEGESAKTDKRKGFQRAISFLRARQADIFLTHKIDRFARNLMDALTYWHEFKAIGVTYCSVAEQFDLTTPVGWLMMVMLATLAELFIKNLSEETKKGKRKRAEKGFWNGDLSLGYKLAADHRHAEMDDATAPIVRLAFELSAQALTDLQIARELNQRGYISRSKRGTKPFSKDTIRQMLRNKIYIGIVTYKGKEYPAQHPPLISDELFNRVQAMRRRRTSLPQVARRRVHIYPLAGLTYCCECQRLLRGHAHRESRYYRDVDHQQGGECRQATTLRADKIEEQVFDALAAVRLPEKWHEQIAVQTPSSKNDTERRRRKAQKRINNAHSLFIDDHINRDEHDRIIAEARAEIETLEPTEAPQLDTAAQLLQDLPRLIAAATLGEKQRLVQIMLERVFVRDGRVIALQPRPDYYPLLLAGYTDVSSGPDERGVASKHPLLVPAVMPLNQCFEKINIPNK